MNSAPAPMAKTVPAGGTVSYRGRPVPSVNLVFHADNLTEPGFATTNSKGEFRCMTNESSDGIPPGDYIVCVSGGSEIPQRYTDPDSSPLAVSVEEDGKNVFTIELTD